MGKNGNHEGSIRKRANGKWEARYSDGRTPDGRQIQSSVYGNTRKEVAEKLHEILYQKQIGTYVPPQNILLKDWLIQWMSNYAAISVRPSTYISYEGYVHNHITMDLYCHTSLDLMRDSMNKLAELF